MTQRFLVQGQQVLALEHDPAADDLTRRIDQTQDREPGHGFARTGLPDQAHDLAPADAEADAVDGMGDAVLGEEMRFQVFDLKGGGFVAHISRPSLSLQTRVEDIAQVIAD